MNKVTVVCVYLQHANITLLSHLTEVVYMSSWCFLLAVTWPSNLGSKWWTLQTFQVYVCVLTTSVCNPQVSLEIAQYWILHTLGRMQNFNAIVLQIWHWVHNICSALKNLLSWTKLIVKAVKAVLSTETKYFPVFPTTFDCLKDLPYIFK